MLSGFLLQIVHEPRERIKTNHLRGIRNEVGKRVYVVETELSVALVDHVLDAAHLDPRCRHESLHLLDDLRGRGVAVHAKAVLGSVQRAGAPRQFRGVHPRADVREAQIEGVPGGVDADSVQELAAAYRPLRWAAVHLKA